MAKEKALEIKRIDVMSVAKIGGLFGLIIGLISALLITFAGITASPIVTSMGALLIILLPITYGIAYFVAGAICAIIYNLIAQRIGGVKIFTN